MASADATGSCLPRIRTRLKHGSKSEANIARVILDDPSRARDLSIAELAAACATSLATVSRFSRGLGYSSFREFQLDLAAALAQSDAMSLDDFPSNATPDAVIGRVFASHRQSLLETERIAGHQALIQVARLIQRKRKVLLLGIGGSSLPARHAAERFLSLGLTAVALADPYMQIFGTANAGPQDVAIGISHTGENIHVIEGIRTARGKGAATVAITNYPKSPLAAASEFRLLTSCHSESVNAAISSSIIEQICVIEALYFVLGSWAGESARCLAEESEHRTQRLVRSRRQPAGKLEKRL